jgi:hypothetical protein
MCGFRLLISAIERPFVQFSRGTRDRSMDFPRLPGLAGGESGEIHNVSGNADDRPNRARIHKDHE